MFVINASIFLSLCISFSNSKKPKCISNIRDTWNEVNGVWANSVYNFPAFMSRENNLTLWYHDACPVQMMIFSCYRKDNDKLKGRSHALEKRRFIPQGCEHDEFTPTKFLNLIRNRNLFLCCDSMSMQIFSNLVCSLHRVTKASYDTTWGDLHTLFYLDCTPGGVHCHIERSKVFYEEYNASISYLGTHSETLNKVAHGYNKLSEYQQFGHLSHRDILILNFGLHFPDAHQYLSLITNLAKDYDEGRDALPILIWRETTPQHFDNPPNGFYLKKVAESCVPYQNLTLAYEADFRNRLSEGPFMDVGVPIIRITNAIRTEYFAHVGMQYRSDEKKMLDCSHFCSPSGVFYHVREVILNVLQTVIHD